MKRFLGMTATVCALALPAAGWGAQTCLSENEIPSSTPTGRFTDNGDGTVTDSETGLMWARCAEGLSGADCSAGAAGRFTWQGALDRAAGSNLAGYIDWQLPNVKELLSLVEQRCVNPAINTTVFPNTPAWDFWSASPSDHGLSFAWYVDFYGGDYYDIPRSLYFGVRLVRSGQ